MTITLQSSGTSLLHIAEKQVHIWRAGEENLPDGLGDFWDTLSGEERAWADTFRFDADKRRFVFCRALLRQLLGRYLDLPAREIEFCTGRYGKPQVVNESDADGGPPIQFNISHTMGRYLFAFSPTLPVGIDVEVIDPTRDWESTSRHFFHPGERAFLQSMPVLNRAAAG